MAYCNTKIELSCLFAEDLAQRDRLQFIEKWQIEDGVDDHVELLQSKWPQNGTKKSDSSSSVYPQEIPSVLGKLLLHDLVVQTQKLEKT